MGVKTDRKFHPDNLRSAREARGLTIRQLADEIEISHQAISKYENGKSIPSAEVLMRIMDIVKVPYEYFFNESRTAYSNEVVYFRSKANTTAKMKRIHEVKIAWLIKIFEKLETILDFPELNVPEYQQRNKGFHFEPTSMDEIEKMALELRAFWGLNDGPITDLTHLFEKNGIAVSVIKSEGYSVDACSKWTNDRLYILVGNERSTPGRIKFTLAHELGHYILHKNIKLTEFNNKEVYSQMEKEANHFASAFLLPANSFSNELISNSLDYFLLLKKRWQVSIQAMVYRAKELCLINEYQSSYLWKQINKKGWRFEEPHDELLIEEPPSLLKDAFDLIFEHNVRSKKQLCNEIGLSHFDIEILANLPNGYLNNNIDKKNIISFKR